MGVYIKTYFDDILLKTCLKYLNYIKTSYRVFTPLETFHRKVCRRVALWDWGSQRELKQAQISNICWQHHTQCITYSFTQFTMFVLTSRNIYLMKCLHLSCGRLPNQVISLILIFGCICRSYMFPNPSDREI